MLEALSGGGRSEAVLSHFVAQIDAEESADLRAALRRLAGKLVADDRRGGTAVIRRGNPVDRTKLLARITADGEAPRLAIAAWFTAVVTVLGCSIAAIALLLIEAAGHWDSPDALLVSCWSAFMQSSSGTLGKWLV